MEYFNKIIEDVEKELETNVENGLKSKEISERQEKYGFNELEGKKKESLLIKFLKALCLNQYATATAQPGLAVNKIEQVLIPLPPLAEQKRIVAKIVSVLAAIAGESKV